MWVYKQSAKDWARMDVKPVRPPYGTDRHWNDALETWQSLHYNDIWHLHESLFAYRPCRVQYKRKNEQYLKDHNKSCWYHVVFSTQQHLDLLKQRDEDIRQREQELRDKTLQDLTFHIPGVCCWLTDEGSP